MDVVVTGIGAVSACGVGAQALWDGMSAGVSCSGTVERLARDGQAAPAACEVPGFDPGSVLGPKGLRLLDRSTLLALVATHLAIEDAGLAGLSPGWEGMRSPGLVVGTSFGSVASIVSYIGERLTKGPTALNPGLFPNTVVNSPASQAAIRFGFTTLCTTIATGWASGAEAIGYAADALRRGRVDVVLAGGVDELTADNLAVYRDLGLVPGICLGEGACLLVLERAGAAVRRGAKPLARLRGRGSGFGLGSGIARGPGIAQGSEPGRPGDAGGLRRAVAEAGPGNAVDLLVSGGHGTHLAEAEAAALSNLAFMAVAKPKTVLGEADGAGGALGAAIAALAVARGHAPGYNSEVNSALVSAPSYTGHAAALVFERFDP